MRCKFCGSKAIYPYKNHEQAGAGRVIAGAIIAGPIGAVTGLAGKNVNGYRCSACGMFSEQPMDFIEEMSVNSAVNSARNGDTLSYERYQARYANLEFVPVRQVVKQESARLPDVDYDEDDVELLSEAEPVNESTKHSYSPNQYVVGSPVFISNVTIKDDNGTDVLLLDVNNISGKTLRSVYLSITVYDDVGDQINTSTFAYQGLSAATGETLPQAKPFNLNTNVAYKVDVTCEKAAFTDDTVWRKEEKPTIYSVPEKTELVPESFAQHKYLRVLLEQKDSLRVGQKLYYPVVEETHRLCVCGNPAVSGSKCAACGLDEADLQEVMDYDVLLRCRKDVIAKNAQERTEALRDFIEQISEEKYQKAIRLKEEDTQESCNAAMEIFVSIGDYKDANDLCASCKARIEELIAEQEVQTEIERKDRIYAVGMDYMNRRAWIENYESAIAEFKKIPGWKDADEQIIICQQKIEDLKVLREAERQERERQAEIARVEAAAAAKKRKNRNIIIAICAAVLAMIGAFAYILVTVIIPDNNYNAAYSLMEQGRYEEAIVAFEALNGYKDSAEQLAACKQGILLDRYDEGIALLNEGKYEEAYTVFEELGNFQDSATQCKEARYLLAMTYWNKKDYESSNPIFKELGSYKDSKQKIHTHEYASQTVTAPGCETKGEEKLTCKTCPHTYTQAVNASGHSYGQTQVTKAATCTATGEKKSVCSTCGKAVTETIAMLDHSYSGTVTKAASCEADGTKTFSCKCGKSYTETIKATGHSYNGGVITTAATCDKDGVKTFSCKCGKSYTEIIKATGHNYSAATCTAASVCANCKHTRQAALGHNNKDNRCTRCNKNLSESFTTVIKYGESGGIGYLDEYKPAYGRYKVTVTVLNVEEGYGMRPLLRIGHDYSTYFIEKKTSAQIKPGAVFTATFNYKGTIYLWITQCDVEIFIEPID